ELEDDAVADNREHTIDKLATWSRGSCRGGRRRNDMVLQRRLPHLRTLHVQTAGQRQDCCAYDKYRTAIHFYCFCLQVLSVQLLLRCTRLLRCWCRWLGRRRRRRLLCLRLRLTLRLCDRRHARWRLRRTCGR